MIFYLICCYVTCLSYCTDMPIVNHAKPKPKYYNLPTEKQDAEEISDSPAPSNPVVYYQIKDGREVPEIVNGDDKD